MRTLPDVSGCHLLGTTGQNVYGNNKTDAKNIGFDDSFIYDELALKPADRKLPSEVLLHNEAITAFEAWMSKEDKVEY